MILRLLSLLIFTTFILCCTKKDEANTERLSGKYKGVFIRGTDTANVEIEFTEGTFSGKSDKIFPGICNGQALQQKDVVYFSNTCTPSVSVDFLSGNYFYYQKDNYLSFWKTLNGVTVNYRLNR